VPPGFSIGASYDVAEVSAALDERWRVEVVYAYAGAVSGDLVAVGSWSEGAVLRRVT
jgi:hypothetical protein